MKSVEWVVESREDDVVMIAFEEDEEGDVTYYVMDPADAAMLGAALFDAAEEIK